ncbi:hypothetical protein CYLTODRAFT_365646 [Cylindrobasidium torrendii FP15055 ss-10]|uniref:Alpha/beta hydrolase fold-3 domain-containing protein n=1 Tax=Cylindrobasidium torrendii FP15055 ss-10 TaxID=1314674 RepID=A0A0D7BTH4_9AGAR|nr:hypothetical protein CYLTODRAFT_365646 [Cylindrobasidium torrendii FP15055 ss-10]
MIFPMDAASQCSNAPVASTSSTANWMNELEQYTTPGVSPASARISTSLEIAARPPFRPWHYYKYGWALASKAAQVSKDVASHAIWGPRKKTWGLEMTIISSFMRDVAAHSSLVDISSIRLLMSLSGLAPLPSDALVTPVTFRIRRRRLRGILADLDSKENGSRELSGEWVVGKKTWRRLQAEWKAAQVIKKGTNKQLNSRIRKKSDRVVYYIHGGAYIVGSPASQRQISVPLALHTDARVFAIDYRLAPESTFPGPLHDVVSGYMRLVEDLHVPPENIIVSGDSAGGGLSLALLMYLRDNGYPLPSSAILMSPWVDLTMSCESWVSNAPYDVIPLCSPTDPNNPIASYLGPHLEKYLMHPYASPLFGNFAGLPPLLIQAGDAEVLRDEITLLAHKASAAGVEVQHELYEDCVHVFQQFPFLEPTERSFIAMGEFVLNKLPQLQSRSPRLEPKAEQYMETEIDSKDAFVLDANGLAIPMGQVGARSRLENDDSTDEEGSSAGTANLANSSRPRLNKRSHSSYTISEDWHKEASQPPTPSVRRNASHADVSALVDNWRSGPKNKTVLYRHSSPLQSFGSR